MRTKARAAIMLALAVLLGVMAVIAGCAGTGAPSATGMPGPMLTADFIDVGQGDAILLRIPDSGTGTERIIVEDTGIRDATLTRVIPFLKSQGIRRIDVLVISHMHDDHAGGLFDILDRFPVGRLVLSGFFYSDSEYLYFLSRLTPYGIPYFFPRRGERLDWGPDVAVEVLNPPELFYTGSSSDDNLNSLVIRLTHGSNSLLLAGDVEETAERNIADAFPGRVDVLKVAHHGGAGSSSQFFLDVYRPRISVISVGRDNDYGHPSQSTLYRLERYSRVYRTDINGTITLRMNGRDIDVSSER